MSDETDLFGAKKSGQTRVNGGRKTAENGGKRQQVTPRNRVKQRGDVGGKTALARDLFFNGNGDGKPVCDINRLAEMSGASPLTLEKWVPVWKRERVALLRAETAGNQSLVARVTEESLALDSKICELLKCEMRKLELVLPKLSVGSELHTDVTASLMKIHARWRHLAGIEAYHEVQLTVLKEEAKQTIRANRSQSKGGPEERQAIGFTFPTDRKD